MKSRIKTTWKNFTTPTEDCSKTRTEPFQLFSTTLTSRFNKTLTSPPVTTNLHFQKVLLFFFLVTGKDQASLLLQNREEEQKWPCPCWQITT